MKKEKVFIIKVFAFVLFAVILTASITYAYFELEVEGNEEVSTISVGGAQLSITYQGTETITAENVIPGWRAKKYFNITSNNPANIPITFDVVLVIDKSNFNTGVGGSNSYLYSYMYKCSSSSDKTCSQLSGIIVWKQGGKITQQRITTTANGTEYYAFELVFPDTGVEQNQTGTDGAVLGFQGHLEILPSGGIYENDTPFATDSWATIASNIKSGNTSRYNVGDTKEVAIDGFTNSEPGSNGLYTVRVANNSNYSCSLASQTACGFVVEFVDIITRHNMNPAGTYNGTYYQYGTNLGGWPSSSMRDYIQNTLLGKLPSDLQSVIENTTVISGHGRADKNTARTDHNWESTDKLYLLTSGEIYSNCLTVNCYDTASYPYNGSGATTTRQLDYYNGVTTGANYERTIKQSGGYSTWWWLRAANSINSNFFSYVYGDCCSLHQLVLCVRHWWGCASFPNCINMSKKYFLDCSII